MLPAGTILKCKLMRNAVSIVMQDANTDSQNLLQALILVLLRRLSWLLPQAVTLVADNLFRDAFLLPLQRFTCVILVFLWCFEGAIVVTGNDICGCGSVQQRR